MLNSTPNVRQEGKHYVILPLAAWGHLRPLIHFAFNLLRIDTSLQITILVDPPMAPRIDFEMREHHLVTAVADRIQIVPIIEINQTDIIEDLKASGKETMEAYLLALFGHPNNGISSKFAVLPTVAIFDWFQVDFVNNLKAVSKKLGRGIIPTLVFTPMLPSAIHQWWRPAEQNGCGEKWSNRVQKLIKDGREKYEAYEEIFFWPDNSVVKVPGLPDRYEWEIVPQIKSIAFTPQWGEIVDMSRKIAYSPEVRGIIFPSLYDIESQAVDEIATFMGKNVFAVGPQFGSDVWEGVAPDSSNAMTAHTDEGEDEALVFLDEQLKGFGPSSVVYISFGSLFWPVKRPELVTWLIDSIPQDMSYLISDAAAMTALSAETKDRIEKTGRGKVVKFAPQWKVLNHLAVNLFVSHLGSNSMQEAILSETPTIAFPFCADQQHAATILSGLGVTIELKQCITGHDGQTRFDGSVVDSSEEGITAEIREAFRWIRGEEGALMRERLRELKKHYVESWKHGESREALERFGKL